MSKQTKCPNCGSYKITTRRKLGIILIMAGITFGWLIIPLFFALAGFILLLMPRENTCLNCQFRFR